MNKDEGLRMKMSRRREPPDWNAAAIGHPEAYASGSPSSFRLRSGLSLMEVLISVFVLSIGLIGLAALLPVGRLAIVADGQGRPGRVLRPRRTLYRQNLPHGGLAKLVQQHRGQQRGVVRRRPVGIRVDKQSVQPGQLRHLLDFADHAQGDDRRPGPAVLQYAGRPDVQRAQRSGPARRRGRFHHQSADTDARRQLFLVLHGHAVAGRSEHEHHQGRHGKCPAEEHYMVSIVVCYRRDLSTGNGETTATVSLNNDPTCGYVTLSSFSSGAPFNVKENEWIALCGGTPAQCRWYRVVSVGDNSGTQYLSLNGPDCTGWTPTTAVLVGKSVVGVYTEPVQVDRDLLW